MSFFATLRGGKGAHYGGDYPYEQRGDKKVRGNTGDFTETGEARRGGGEVIVVSAAGMKNNEEGEVTWGNGGDPWESG